MSMFRKFGYFEPAVKPKVRNNRNDAELPARDNSDMSKRQKADRWFVKEWLVYKKLRQKDLVAGTDWNKSQVNEWVNEKERWNRDVLFAFAHVMDVDPSDLLKLPPSGPVDDDFARLALELDERQKARLLRLWDAAKDEAA